MSPGILQHRARALALVCALALPICATAAGRAYVSNEDEHTVSVIDTDKGTVISTIQIGKRPRGVKLSHDGKLLYAAVSGLPKCPPSVPDEECEKLERDLKADGIAVVDTTTLKVTTVLKAGSDPEQFDLMADGKQLVVANEDTSSATVLELPSGAIKTKIAVGKEPEGVRVSPNGHWIFVTNESDGSVSMIDAKTLKVQKSVKVGQRPRDIAFTPDDKSAYVSGEFDASIYKIAIPNGDPVERILQLRKEARPMSVILDPKQNRLYVSTGRGGTVAVIDTTKNALVTEVAVGARPWGMALSADGSRIYTANGPSNDVSIVDTKTLQVLKKIPVGKSPWGITLSR
jgi:YVTN family beta-propeller protein